MIKANDNYLTFNSKILKQASIIYSFLDYGKKKMHNIKFTILFTLFESMFWVPGM